MENLNQPWLDRNIVVVPGISHNLPKQPDRLLPKYDLDIFGKPEDHIKKFILAIRLMNVQHEDIVYILFPYTFENKALTWNFSLPTRCIMSWETFQKFSLKNLEIKLPLELS